MSVQTPTAVASPFRLDARTGMLATVYGGSCGEVIVICATAAPSSIAATLASHKPCASVFVDASLTDPSAPVTCNATLRTRNRCAGGVIHNASGNSHSRSCRAIESTGTRIAARDKGER